MDNPTHDEKIEKVRELIKGIEFAMLTTIAEGGQLHSRPMATQKAEFDGDVWFFTKASAHKVREVAQDDHVNVSYAAPDDNRFVSLSGRAQIVRDKAKIKELWSSEIEAWFPEGPDGPDVALLKIVVDQAEYWDGPSSIVYVLSLAKSLVTGERPDVGEYAKVDMK